MTAFGNICDVIIFWSCVVHRQPAPDPGGSCTSSRLSI